MDDHNTMKNILVLLLLACPLAYGSQAVGTVNISSTVGGNAVAPSMTNTAGNFLFTNALVSCTVTNPNSVFAYAVNSGTPNQDSNGNVWNVSVDSKYTFSSTTRAKYFLWTIGPINGGSNVVTYKNQASDCQILVGIQNEYAGFYPWNAGSYRVNGNFMPFGAPDSNTTFPVNADATYVVQGAANLTMVVGINEGTSGTWGINSTWSAVASATANGTQMQEYDGTTGTGPTSITLSNDTVSSTHALGDWEIFNRTPPPTPGTGGGTGTCVGSAFVSTATTIPCRSTISLNPGDVVVGTLQGALESGSGADPTGYTIHVCGSDPVSSEWNNDSVVAGFVYVSNSTQTCTPSVTYTGTPSFFSTLLFVEVYPNLSGTNFAAYPVVFPLKGYENGQATVQSGITIPNYDASDTIISITAFRGICNLTPFSTTFTQDQFTTVASSGGGICLAAQTMYANGATTAGGPYTNTMTATSTIFGQYSYYVVLRRTMPSLGVVQEKGCTTALPAGVTNPVSSLICTLPQTPGTGHQITGELADLAPLSTIQATDGTNTWACPQRGMNQNGNVAARYFKCNLNSPTPVGPVSVVVTPSSGTSNYDLIIKDDVGLSSTGAFAGKSDGTLRSGTTSTTQHFGPIYLQQPGNYLMEAPTWSQGFGVESRQFTPASPYGLTYQFQFSNFLGTDSAAIITASSLPSAQTGTVTTELPLSPLTDLFAEAAFNYTYPIVIQGQQGFTLGGPNVFTVSDAETGAGIIACASIDGGGDSTITSSDVTLLPVVSGPGFRCSYAYKPVPASVSVTFDSTGSPAMNLLMKVRNLGLKDDAQFTSSVSYPISSEAIAHAANEIWFGFGSVTGSSTGSYPYLTSSTGCNGVQDNVNGVSDKVSNSASTSFLAAATTCGATWQPAPGFGDGTSWTSASATFGFDAPPPPVTSQPFVVILSKNDPQRYLGEWHR